MQVNVYSLAQAEVLEPIPNTVVISITVPPWPANLKEGWEDVLRLEFHDVVRASHGEGLVLFNMDHVEAIYEFVEKHVEAGKDFVVHCNAGQSRSVAVGLFLKEIHDGELHLHATGTDTGANSRVHRGLLRRYWKRRFDNE